MGQFKDQGDPAFALSEECAEVIQVISKYYRFGTDWNEIPEGKTMSRWDMLKAEMEDLMYQWDRLKEDKAFEDLLRKGLAGLENDIDGAVNQQEQEDLQ